MPAGAGWPAEYDGGYLYADFVLGTVFLLKESGQAPCLDCNPPVSNQNVTVFAEIVRNLNMNFGPYQDTMALYYSTVPAEIRRIVYTGMTDPAPTPGTGTPAPVSAPTPDTGTPAPVSVPPPTPTSSASSPFVGFLLPTVVMGIMAWWF